jgi:hypothetical protein
MSRAASAATQGVSLAVRACAWALRSVANTLLARLAVAAAVLYLAAIIAFYALWIGAMLWFVVGRFGVVRDQRRKPIAARVTAASACLGLAAYCGVQGSSFTRCTIIAVMASTGALVWFNRHAVFTTARSEFASARPQLRA